MGILIIIAIIVLIVGSLFLSIIGGEISDQDLYEQEQMNRVNDWNDSRFNEISRRDK